LVFDDKGLPVLDFRHATKEQMRTIAEFSFTESGRPRLKMRDPAKYLEMLARHRGLLRDEISLTGGGGLGPAVMRVEFVRAQDGRVA
jgi:hypothetical protein